MLRKWLKGDKQKVFTKQIWLCRLVKFFRKVRCVVLVAGRVQIYGRGRGKGSNVNHFSSSIKLSPLEAIILLHCYNIFFVNYVALCMHFCSTWSLKMLGFFGSTICIFVKIYQLGKYSRKHSFVFPQKHLTAPTYIRKNAVFSAKTQ